jgi:threonine aldolase
MDLNVEFGSDNHSGVHPDIMQAIIDANTSYEIAYGDDQYTKSAVQTLKEVFKSDSDVFFVYNGTAANILGLKTVTKPFDAILCANTAHLYVHECCGPETFIGSKLIPIQTQNGKLTPKLIHPHLIGKGDVHMAQPRVISITQPTELGTTYTIGELSMLCDFAHKHNLLFHMDGARLCNAAVFLKKELKEITSKVGVDILSFGGTKNGMMYGEAVIFFNHKFAKNFKYYRKQGMQLTSKMRFISAQFTAFFTNDLWRKNANHANNMAQYLKNKLSNIPAIKIIQPVEANMVFISLPKKALNRLQKDFYFHITDEKNNVARLMCSYNTKKEVIDLFIRKLIEIL